MSGKLRLALLAGGAVLVQAGVGHAQDAASGAVGTVIVTARKQAEPLAKVPESITVFSAADIATLDIRTFADFAVETPDLSFAYGNGSTAIGDARTIAIRGVSGANTTGVYIDDTPVPDSLDPRLVDLARVEVLRGPQGTLYGESSLGGNIRYVTRAPSFSTPSGWVQGDVGATSHGGAPDLGLEGAGDAVLVPDRVALRVSGFWDQDAGYLTRTFPDPADPSQHLSRGDQGAQQSYGGAAALAVRITNSLDLDLRLIAQGLQDHGFPAAFAPLPAFEPISTLDRAYDIQPSVSDRWLLPSATLSWHAGAWRVSSTTSWLHRTIHELEDSSIGTAQAITALGAAPPAQPYAWHAKRTRSQVAHETRASFDGPGPLTGTFGVYVSDAHDDFVIPPIQAQGLAETGAWPDDLLWRSDIRDSEQDVALFGEAYVHLPAQVTLTLGARQYWLRQTYHLYADGFFNEGVSDGAPGKNAESGVSPKAALSWQATPALQLYASAAKGFRAGGSGQAVIPSCDASLAQIGLTEASAAKYNSDTVWSYEAGAKAQLEGGRLLLSADAYHLDWDGIQQSVFLPSCAYIITANAGAAAADGGEVELSGEPLPGVQVRLGAGIEDARITRAGDTGQAVGDRVFEVPRATATAALTWRRRLGGDLVGIVGADVGWVGDSVSFNSTPGLPLVRPAYAQVNARIGVERGSTSVLVSLRNLTNARPNLGDIGYLGYEQYTAQGSPLPQVATLPPLTARLEVRQAF